uniref:Biotinidase n=1 Tax=Sphaeramia orbicularis TaxID=375764 RepID=A0A672YBV3_9TELE
AFPNHPPGCVEHILFLLFAVFSGSWTGQTVAGLDSSYIAAVFEHRVILNPEPHVPLSRHHALQHLQKNLDVYEEQAARAAQQGAQILVFPEDGLQGFNFTRTSISGYLETIPDPQQESWNPCMEPDKHKNTEHFLLCCLKFPSGSGPDPCIPHSVSSNTPTITEQPQFTPIWLMLHFVLICL